MRLLSYLHCLTFALACQSPTPEAPPTIAPPAADTHKIVDIPTPAPIAPPIPPDFDTVEWAELILLDSSFVLDLKYATSDNFVEEQMYDCPRCFLRPEVAQTLVDIHQQLQAKGFGLKLLDCYRPRPIQQKLWDKVPNPSYVTPPKKGSMHNRGRAVDLTLVDVQGQELDMGTPFDFFGPRAHHTHTDLPPIILERRKLLKSTMEANGFRSIRTEWWHYYYARGGYPLADWLWNCEGHEEE